ncbi:hypothetical protein PFICI_00090 [Pestalotiopsis fici W106-1]|uniref:Amidohydrolase-related domain-containing protein n=1 Tax=Pestalotiopsis fici (strain W106-1 / CGMCC3.15140) TaxID=1229662 RepID=W3XLD4_PESFW|nr:uncharacterized protein PFICI_00090 [Pestalotiopsis fici W106-1]ETS86262.1 hypothetical protein PFICI_00090 [Pestalotiopsis fici W106-1]
MLPQKTLIPARQRDGGTESSQSSIVLSHFWKNISYILAVVGLAHLLNGIWQTTRVVFTPKNTDERISHSDPYPDTDYPLRPATEPWDISQSYEYSRNFTKTVSNGTWLRITTHPIKDEIVFDMLGDLYCMSSGETSTTYSARKAHAFLTGVPFDKEAEFSSDGTQLVFISDAGFGVDNIWTLPYTSCDEMAQVASDETRKFTVQQTNSTFRFFSSPAFHPTEPKIIATKWYLTGRPNGAGEIWEIPLLQRTPEILPNHGGKRLIARQIPASWPREKYFESQLGAEQARYSADGSAVVFTRNSKDKQSGKFSYNKDVHAGINAVYSLDLSNSHVTELVAAAASAPNQPASPGGASMPRLSHDGKTLAFVRRVDDKSVLVLKHMESGTIHYAWDGLTYDLSMIPAFMGAYPNFGWVANDTALVIWAQGLIWRVPVALDALGERVGNGAPFALPFEASIELELGRTRYSTRDIREAELAQTGTVTSLHGLRSNEAGDSVVFEAAGDNYMASLDSQSDRPTITALEKPNKHTSCYAPSFVHGSPFLLQACWNARNLTSFHLLHHLKGSIIKVHGLPRGRYVSPVSNGLYIAYVRTGKDYMFGDVEETFGDGVWIGRLTLPGETLARPTISDLEHISSIQTSHETKLDISMINGQPTLIVQNPNKIVLHGIQTGVESVLVTGRTTVEMTALPATKQHLVAFRDFQHVWFSYDGNMRSRAIWSKPGDVDTPSGLVRLTETGGHDVTISGDGRRIFWLNGPTLEYVDVDNVATACRMAPSELRDCGACSRPWVRKHHLNIRYQTTTGAQAISTQGRAFAIVNATVISMSTTFPMILKNATIIIQAGQIIDVGESIHTSLPKETDLHDAEGGAVLPGFIDMHGHWGGFLSPYPQPSWEMETFLGYGVTTIHNPSSKNVNGMVERHLIEKGRMYGPRVFHTGDVLYGSTQPSVYTEINSRSDARDALMRVKAEGGSSSFSVKNYQIAPRSARQRLLFEAADLDMLVLPEGGWSLDWDLTYFIDGYTTLEHPVPVPELYDDVISLIAASGSSYTPLAVMNYGGIFGQHWVHQNHDIQQDKKLRNYVKHDILESLTEVKKAPMSSYQFFNTTKSTAEVARRGVRTNVGSHGEQPIGYLFHSEMHMMALGGQKPYDVLRHATMGGAISLGLQAAIGSIEPGKLADLVIYPAGVSTVEAVFNSSMHMKNVMSRGTLFAVEEGLVEIWPRKGRRQTRTRLNPDNDL